MTLRSAILAAAFAWASVALADTPPTPAPTLTPDPKEELNLESFGAAHVECLEWNDGCATCKRTMSVHCSTTGIACLPGKIVCVSP